LKVGSDAGNAGFDLQPEGAGLAIWLDGGDGSADFPDNSNANNVVIANLPAVMLIEGGVGTRSYLTTEMIQDSTGAVVFDQATQLTAGLAGFDDPTYLGAANAGDDWLSGWTVGLDTALNP
jgi:hypothetical protein